MKILVTGGAGVIRSKFFHAPLRDHPSAQPVVLDKLTYAGNLRNLESALQTGGGHFVRMDICEPEGGEAVKSWDAVGHFGGESHVDGSIEDASPFMRTNVEGTWRLVESCRVAKLRRFLHVSTDEVYGSLGPVEKSSESAALAPTSPYAASKAATDLLVQSAVRTYGFPAIITRCTNNYGPFQFPEKFIPLMISRALAGETLPVHGDGKNVRDWIHVSDHCRALDLILRKGRDGEIYNVGGGCELENITVAKKILRVLGKAEDLLHFVADRLAHDRRNALDSPKLNTKLRRSQA